MAAVTGVVHGLGQRPALLQSSDSAMREAANKLEANFVAEMVTPKHLMGCRVLVCSRDVRAAR
jgi:hypothetical protein